MLLAIGYWLLAIRRWGAGSCRSGISFVVGDVVNLVAYRLAVAIASEVHGAVAGWPSFERWTIGLQLVRAAGSIGANIAEAEGRFQPKDRQRFLFIARGSLEETRHWLRLADAQGRPIEVSGDQLDQLGRKLNGLIRATGSLASAGLKVPRRPRVNP